MIIIDPFKQLLEKCFLCIFGKNKYTEYTEYTEFNKNDVDSDSDDSLYPTTNNLFIKLPCISIEKTENSYQDYLLDFEGHCSDSDSESLLYSNICLENSSENCSENCSEISTNSVIINSYKDDPIERISAPFPKN